MAKKQLPEAKKGSPAWMTTYSDMMTLLFCFFVLLFSMSNMDAAKMKQIAEGLGSSVISIIQSGTGTGTGSQMGNGIVQLPNSGRGLKPKADSENDLSGPEYQELNQIATDFENSFNQIEESDKIGLEVDIVKHSVNIKVKDSILFDKSKADLKDEAKYILDELALMMVNYPDNELIIEGHTDSDVIRTAQFDSNWELSSIRAIAVVRYLVEQKGLSPVKVSGVGYGAFRNIVPNDTEENKSKNRRVEIKIMSSVSSESSPVTSGD